jgi:hypothetical protein
MKYSNAEIDLIRANLTPLSNRDLLSRYEDLLDDCYGEISICGYKYYPSVAFKKVDLVGFELGYSDWLSGELGETLVEIKDEYFDNYEVQNLLNGENV